MSEKFGAVMHPVLGGLLHYTTGVFTTPNESLEEAGMRSRVVN